MRTSIRPAVGVALLASACGAPTESNDEGTTGTETSSGTTTSVSATSTSATTATTSATSVDTGGSETGSATTSASESDSGGTDTGGTGPMPLGQVMGGDPMPCPNDDQLPPDAECHRITVSCPDVDDVDAIVAVVSRPDAVGTIALHGGGGGTSFFNRGFAPAYLEAGYRVALIAWMNDWEASGGAGIRAAACRPATAFDWIFTEIHGGDDATPYCAQGHSGGSGAIAYALAHYGLENDMDHALVSASTPFARIDYGCAPDELAAPPSPCPEIPDAPYAYGGVAAMLDGWEGTQGCGMPDPDPTTLTTWHTDSIVSDGADWNYATTIDAWLCANNPNETTGQGALWFESIESELAVTCVQGMIGDTACTGEGVFADPGAFDMMVAGMVAGCVP